ncbi:hypothetical protein MMK25_35240, partial [Bacillus cereus]|nr:hypothetical protein [Bacillus cereus]
FVCFVVAGYSIFCGNAANELMLRFTETEFMLLMEMSWFYWVWNLFEMAIPLLSCPSIEPLFAFYNNVVIFKLICLKNYI